MWSALCVAAVISFFSSSAKKWSNAPSRPPSQADERTTARSVRASDPRAERRRFLAGAARPAPTKNSAYRRAAHKSGRLSLTLISEHDKSVGSFAHAADEHRPILARSLLFSLEASSFYGSRIGGPHRSVGCTLRGWCRWPP
eukprot:1175731-Prorocentrum_minimum.AAC.2